MSGFYHSLHLTLNRAEYESLTPHATTMCSDSYPIPTLSLFFLYHPYIPYFLIRRMFLFSSLLPFFTSCIHHTRCSHQMYNSNGDLAPSPIGHINHSKRSQYKKPLHVTNEGPQLDSSMHNSYLVCWCVLIRVLEILGEI